MDPIWSGKDIYTHSIPWVDVCQKYICVRGNNACSASIGRLRAFCDSNHKEHSIGQVADAEAYYKEIDVCCGWLFGRPVICESHIQCLKEECPSNDEVIKQLNVVC